MAETPIAATYLSATSFSVASDKAAEFLPGVRVLADCGVDGTRMGTVTSDGVATVVIVLDSGVLTANLTGVLHGNDIPDSLCNHAAQHMLGARDVIAPSDIGAMPADRRIDTIGPLQGGGDLWSDLELSIDGASESGPGAVELATAAEAAAGTDTTRAVTAEGLLAAIIANRWSAAPSGGECRLTYTSATVLTLVRYDGMRIIIDDVIRAIPSAGVTLANPGVANTTYYIYAYWTGTAIALEYSTTGYTADSRNGVMAKTGDASRTLVGMARTNSSGQWVSGATQRWVVSYFKPKPARVYAVRTSDVSTSSTTLVDLTPSDFVSFLSFGVDSVSIYAGIRSSCTQSTTNQTNMSNNGSEVGGILIDLPVAYNVIVSGVIINFLPVIGLNNIKLIGLVGGGTGTWHAWGTLLSGVVLI